MHIDISSSLITRHLLGKRIIYIKRDDMLTVQGLSGNKVRKFWNLMYRKPFPNTIASFGGAQSNAMLAIAKIAHNHPSTSFVYFTNPLPTHVSRLPGGNLKTALDLGMKLVEVSAVDYAALVAHPHCSSPPSQILHIASDLHPQWDIGKDLSSVHWVPQGGASVDCSVGVQVLAEEIVTGIRAITADAVAAGGGGGSDKEEMRRVLRPWKVMVASGTGAMALFLSRSIRRLMADESMTNGAADRIDVEVVAVPCVASSSAHTDMLTRLDAETGVTGHVPRVLSQGDEEGVEMQKYRFGRPSKALFDTWEMVQRETGVDFDLLYAPRAWQLLMRHDLWTNDDVNVMYYHCGGLEGNDSMMKRYMRIKNRSSS